MTEITIDLNDDKATLTACRNMLTELIVGEARADHSLTAERQSEASDEPDIIDELTPTAATAAATSAEVDQQGVAFNAEFCGKAKDPFYATGGRQGQWKKRKGVTDEEYTRWYDKQGADPQLPTNDPEPEVDTSSAFSRSVAAQAKAAAPADVGEFMAWASEKQAAGLLTQDDIGEVYTSERLTVSDLFAPTPTEAVEANIERLYRRLMTKAGV